MEKHWGWNRKLIGILRKRRAEEPPVTPVRVAMGKLGTFKNLSGAVHECNQWIELWTNAIHILDGPCDIGDIEASTIDALFEETQETVDAATASICNQMCRTSLIGSGYHRLAPILAIRNISNISILIVTSQL